MARPGVVLHKCLPRATHIVALREIHRTRSRGGSDLSGHTRVYPTVGGPPKLFSDARSFLLNNVRGIGVGLSGNFAKQISLFEHGKERCEFLFLSPLNGAQPILIADCKVCS